MILLTIRFGYWKTLLLLPLSKLYGYTCIIWLCCMYILLHSNLSLLVYYNYMSTLVISIAIVRSKSVVCCSIYYTYTKYDCCYSLYINYICIILILYTCYHECSVLISSSVSFVRYITSIAYFNSIACTWLYTLLHLILPRPPPQVNRKLYTFICLYRALCYSLIESRNVTVSELTFINDLVGLVWLIVHSVILLCNVMFVVIYL